MKITRKKIRTLAIRDGLCGFSFQFPEIQSLPSLFHSQTVLRWKKKKEGKEKIDNSKGYIIYWYVCVRMGTVGMYRISNLILWRGGKKPWEVYKLHQQKGKDRKGFLSLATFALLSLFILQGRVAAGCWMIGIVERCAPIRRWYIISTKPWVI